MNEISQLADKLKKAEQFSNLHATSHCRLSAGDIVGGYEIVRQLGKGRFAIVWEAKRVGINNECNVAIKMFRVGTSVERYYVNEVRILNKIFEKFIMDHVPPPNLVGYLGTFAHVAFTSTTKLEKEPAIHPCILFNLCGDTVSSLLKYCRRNYGGGLPIKVVKKIMRGILRGLAYLHANNIIHTDIKPSNILLDRKVDQIIGNDPVNFEILLGDLGSSTNPEDLFSYHVGTTEHCASELILEMKYSFEIDIWAAFTTCYELITGDILFDVYNECGVKYGSDVEAELPPYEGSSSDCEDVDGGLEEVNIINNNNEPSCPQDCNGCPICCGTLPMSHSDSSGSESEDFEKVNYRHLLLIEKVLGKPSKKFTQNGRTYWNARGSLKNTPNVEKVSISQLLINNYDIDPEECKKIEAFLLTGLKWVPKERITAAAALEHSWLAE
jgi:serine/threonine protein kinase